MIDASGNSTIGVLVSGGLDSCILLASLVEEGRLVQPFYIRSGVTWEAEEIEAARRFITTLPPGNLRELVVLDMPVEDIYAGHWSVTGRDAPGADTPDEAVYLPGRNALLLVKAAVWCQRHGVHELALAPLGTSPFGDASTDFIQRFEAAINCGSPASLRILLPFARMNKIQVMHLGRNFSLLHTFSCIAPEGGLHCGRCNKCDERRRSFRSAEISDPTRYAFGEFWHGNLSEPAGARPVTHPERTGET